MDIIREDHRNEKLNREIFHVLNDSVDFEEGINTALDMIGKAYNISRVYIFESCEGDEEYADNTFEWCAAGINAEKDNLKHLSYAEYGYDETIMKNGIFCCTDTSQIGDENFRELILQQGIKAMLQIAIYDKGEFRGFVGFDDCVKVREDWHEDSTYTKFLTYLADLLNIYLIKERNLSASVLYQRELEESLEQLQKASRAKNEFLSNMSHEIRTPMNAIIGMSELCLEEVKDMPKAADMLEKIKSSSTYLLSVINEILDMSRIESGKNELKFDWITPQRLTATVLDMIEPLASSKGITLEYDKRIALPAKFEMYVDVQKTQQMLMNILNNGCKFTRAGGTVKVEFHNVFADPVNHRAKDQIIISDTGCGMSEEFMSKLFSPFEQERTKDNEDVPGTGLGLTISRDIARQMGGDITAKSCLGKGSTFTITYTYEYREISEKSPLEKDKEEFKINLQGKRILLAEDNMLNAEIAITLLEKQGVICTHATNGREAVDIFMASEEGSYHAIIMDIRMPVMDGLSAAGEIRSLERKDSKIIPIIAMSANAYKEDIEKSLEAGMNAHLSKPVEPKLIFKAIEEHTR